MNLTRAFLVITLWYSTLQVFCNPSDTLKVLFIGNSYTYVNDLPGIVTQMALSTGNVVQTASSTPGGYTLQLHSTNSTTLNAIDAGVWNYVVLQEQSQLPALQNTVVETEVYPFAHMLDSLINEANPCTETVFYRTWGRKNGDSQNCPTWPPVCTYQGMDSLLHLRYRIMTDSFAAIMSPVGMVFRYIRLNNPSLELYDADESHPSPAGSYAAACSFYCVLLRQNPELIAFDNGLNPDDAAFIREAAKTVVYDNLSIWNVGKYDPKAAFDYEVNDLTVTFLNLSTNSNQFRWDFGDGEVSNELNPIHTYQNPGTYTATLISSVCKYSDTTHKIVSLLPSSIPALNNGFEFTQSTNYISLKLSKPAEYVQVFDGLGRQLTTLVQPKSPLVLAKTNLHNQFIMINIQFKDGHQAQLKSIVWKQ